MELANNHPMCSGGLMRPSGGPVDGARHTHRNRLFSSSGFPRSFW